MFANRIVYWEGACWYKRNGSGSKGVGFEPLGSAQPPFLTHDCEQREAGNRSVRTLRFIFEADERFQRVINRLFIREDEAHGEGGKMGWKWRWRW